MRIIEFIFEKQSEAMLRNKSTNITRAMRYVGQAQRARTADEIGPEPFALLPRLPSEHVDGNSGRHLYIGSILVYVLGPYICLFQCWCFGSRGLNTLLRRVWAWCQATVRNNGPKQWLEFMPVLYPGSLATIIPATSVYAMWLIFGAVHCISTNIPAPKQYSVF